MPTPAPAPTPTVTPDATFAPAAFRLGLSLLALALTGSPYLAIAIGLVQATWDAADCRSAYLAWRLGRRVAIATPPAQLQLPPVAQLPVLPARSDEDDGPLARAA